MSDNAHSNDVNPEHQPESGLGSQQPEGGSSPWQPQPNTPPQPEAQPQGMAHPAQQPHQMGDARYEAAPRPSYQSAAPAHAQNAFMDAVGAVWPIVKQITGGRPGEAFGIARRVPMLAVVVLLGMAFADALMLGLISVYSINAVADLVNDAASLRLLPSGDGKFFRIFMAMFIIMSLIYILRTAITHWTFAIKQIRVPYRVSASVVAVAWSPLLLLKVVFAVLMLIPTAGLAIQLLGLYMLLAVPFAWAGETLIYIGLNKTARFDTSVLIPYVIMSSVWVVLSFVLFTFIASI